MIFSRENHFQEPQKRPDQEVPAISSAGSGEASAGGGEAVGGGEDARGRLLRWYSASFFAAFLRLILAILSSRAILLTAMSNVLEKIVQVIHCVDVVAVDS